MNDTTRLFGTKTKKDWLDIRAKIIANSSDPKAWDDAIVLFGLRLETRYFEPINRILQRDTTSGEGFAAMTLLCSLIEFLQSCYEGKTYQYDLPKETTFLYRYSQKKFKDFLLQHEPFKTTFSKKLTKPLGNIITFADDFYSGVRCGLLHEAATNNNWTIQTDSTRNPCLTYIDITDENNKIICRDKFFEEIRAYCENYQQKLKNNILDNNKKPLRDGFCRKMDSLCEISDRTPKWWT